MKNEVILAYEQNEKVVGENNPSQNTKISGLTEIKNKTFSNETVILDGYTYIDCEFDNVTFLFNGGDFGFTRVKINRFIMETTNPGFANMLRFLAARGMFNENFKTQYTEKKAPNIISYPIKQ